jgi:hypothetical protein
MPSKQGVVVNGAFVYVGKDRSRIGKVVGLKGPGLADGRPSIARVHWMSGLPRRTEEQVRTLTVTRVPGQPKKKAV